jgi:hypothetical protein
VNFKEFLLEHSFTPRSIRAQLLAKGYKFLGKGVDQSAYLEPKTGRILKIFGTQQSSLDKATADGFTYAHLMFKVWVDYCNKNKANPFLPKYDGWESFELNGKKFLQIRMEPLLELTKLLGRFLEDVIVWTAHNNRKHEKNLNILKNFKERSWTGKVSKQNDGEIEENSKLMLLLGEEKYDLLVKTIREVCDLGKKHGWEIDLHFGNFMMRGDGTPVIVDPWFA